LQEGGSEPTLELLENKIHFPSSDEHGYCIDSPFKRTEGISFSLQTLIALVTSVVEGKVSEV
jgi:hypothetical protein